MSSGTKISRQDLENQFRTLQDEVTKKVDEKKQPALVAGAVGGIVLLLVMYLLGRRSGRKRSAVVSIRRV